MPDRDIRAGLRRERVLSLQSRDLLLSRAFLVFILPSGYLSAVPGELGMQFLLRRGVRAYCWRHREARGVCGVFARDLLPQVYSVGC
jgi:hypothetical protein